MANIFRDRPEWIPSLDEQRRHAGDADFRKAALKALDAFGTHNDHRAGLNSLRRCEASLDALQKTGFVFHEELVRLAVDEFREEHRSKIQEAALEQMQRRLAESLAPHVRRCMSARKAAILSDAKSVTSAVAEIAGKYGASAPRLEIVASLEAVAEQIEGELARGVDFSWHESPRVAVSAYFTEPL